MIVSVNIFKAIPNERTKFFIWWIFAFAIKNVCGACSTPSASHSLSEQSVLPHGLILPHFAYSKF